MDQLHVAAIGLRVAIEHAVADALDLALKKADVPLVRAQTNIVTVGETNLKMIAAGGDDVSGACANTGVKKMAPRNSATEQPQNNLIITRPRCRRGYGAHWRDNRAPIV